MENAFNEIQYITPENAVFSKTDGGFLRLKFGGLEYERVAFYRLFPFSDPMQFISVREFDSKATEIGLIVDVNAFEDEVKLHLIQQISMRYFTPKITRIIDAKDEYGHAYIDVETDRGPCRFTMSAHGDAVMRLSDTRILLRDIDGNRFEIENVEALSEAEMRKIELYI